MELPLSTKQIITISAVIIVAASALYIAYDFNGDSLDFSDRETLLVRTNSMGGDEHPSGYDIGAIPQWSLIMVKKLDTQEEKDAIEVGDVITFMYNGRLTVHRVIEVNRDSGGHLTDAVTRGDNVPSPLNIETPTADQITGVVVGVSVWMGSIVHFAQNSTLLLAVIVIVAIVMVSVVWDIVKATRRREL